MQTISDRWNVLMLCKFVIYCDNSFVQFRNFVLFNHFWGFQNEHQLGIYVKDNNRLHVHTLRISLNLVIADILYVFCISKWQCLILLGKKMEANRRDVTEGDTTGVNVNTVTKKRSVLFVCNKVRNMTSGEGQSEIMDWINRTNWRIIYGSERWIYIVCCN